MFGAGGFQCRFRLCRNLRHLLLWHQQIGNHVILSEHLLHRPLHFPGQHQFQVRGSGSRHFRKTQLAARLGRIFPVSASAAPRKQQEGELDLKERWYPIHVKQKDKDGRPDIDAFEAMMMREDCEKGFFVPFDYSSDALREIESFFKRSHKVIVALIVQEILDEDISKKLV